MHLRSWGSGVVLAFVCLIMLGLMPIIASSRPDQSSALSFAFFLSVWQVVFSLPLLFGEVRMGSRGIFKAGLAPHLKIRTIAIILSTGAIFGLSTFAYVLAVEKAGPVSTAIALQAYPLFAILWETLFLDRRKSSLEMLFTLLLLIPMYDLATGGTWRVEGFSLWFLLALAIPFLWSVAHVIIKEVLGRTPITPAQVTFFRVLVSTLFLGLVLTLVAGPGAILHDAGSFAFQKFALVMGLVYYLELIFWFHAVRHIDVSVASSITVPAPALTMALAILFLGAKVESHQVVALVIVVASVYGLLLAGASKARSAKAAVVAESGT